MTVAYLIEFAVIPAQIDRFEALIGGVLSAMSHEDNFRGCALNRDSETPGRYLLYEAWADHNDVVNVQLARPYRNDWHDALPDLLVSPRVISVWTPIALHEGRAG